MNISTKGGGVGGEWVQRYFSSISTNISTKGGGVGGRGGNYYYNFFFGFSG